MLFQAEFDAEIQAQLAQKRSQSGKTLAEKLGNAAQDNAPQRFKIAGDDENQTLMWKSLMKDCAFYFDVPSIEQENKMRSKLQSRYDGVLSAGWRPPL